MIDTEPTPKTPESLYREAAVLLRKLTEQMPEMALPDEPWTLDDMGKPVLSEIFTDMDFLLATDDDPIADRLYAELYKLFQEAEHMPREATPTESERLRTEIGEFISVYDDEALQHLATATTWELAKDDERRTSLRNNTFRPLQTKMVELVKTPEIRDPESRTNPEYAWFWHDLLPLFLKIRSAHGQYMNDVLNHDMPNWTPLLDYCQVASREL